MKELDKYQIKEGLEQEYAEYVAKNSDDGYSYGTISYAARFASMMESAIAEGKSVSDAAEELQYKADTDGITGFMAGCAAQEISHFWVHGEAFRKWWNKVWGIEDPDAKGVANPVIMTVEVSK